MSATVVADDLEDFSIIPPDQIGLVVRVERVVDYAPLPSARAWFVYVDQKLPRR